MDYLSFLESKPLYYNKIDTKRFPTIYKKLRLDLKATTSIHIVGTNAKGSTGRFIASALHSAGYSVAHYSSPHILKFNERIWLNGADIDDIRLQVAHEKLLGLLDTQSADRLSYFEYTTLLFVVVATECDYAVVEAGLGGEHDATASLEYQLSIFTPIDLDHQALLGDTIEQIATTKLRSMAEVAIVSPQPHAITETIALQIAKEGDSKILKVENLLQKDDIITLLKVATKHELPEYMYDNLQLAAAALNYLNIEFNSNSFDTRLFGRLSKIGTDIYLDVGHNALAAQAIADEFKGKKINLIYNTLGDKEYEVILKILKPIIKEVLIIDIDDRRAVDTLALHGVLEHLNITYREFTNIAPDEKYLIFGSFSVAEAFLNRYRSFVDQN